jgi:hypothetical protein
VITRLKYEGGLVFRDIELFNLALLARQARRILQSPDTLSAKILKAHYFQMTEFLDAQLGNQPSQIWRVIVEGKEIPAQGMIRHIDDGKSTLIWRQNWIPKVVFMRPIACLRPTRPHLVSELIESSIASWKQEMVRATFLPIDADVSLNIPLYTQKCSDFWAWAHEKKGEFTVRSATGC